MKSETLSMHLENGLRDHPIHPLENLGPTSRAKTSGLGSKPERQLSAESASSDTCKVLAPKPARYGKNPVVDNCLEGNCITGTSTDGQAQDSSYRDGDLKDGAFFQRMNNRSFD